MLKGLAFATVAVLSTSSAVLAAGLPPPPVSTYNWSGFYMGMNGGGVWNNSSFNNTLSGPILGPLGTTLNSKIQGNQAAFTIGGEMGYNWQMTNVVFGLETDFNYMNYDKTRYTNLGGTDFAKFTANAHWYGTTVGVLGYAVNNFLLFGTGGLAYGRANASGDISIGANAWNGSETNWNIGWTLGAGVKYAVTPIWILGAEYKYVNLGKSTFGYSSTTVGDSITGNTKTAFSVVRATLDFRF